MYLKRSKRFLAVLLVVAVLVGACTISNYQVISAKTKLAEESCEEATENIYLGVVTSDGEISMIPELYSVGMTKYVLSDGVRLRKKASLTSTVLELMYKGEVVTVYPNIEKGFVYVKRMKTGTKGYVSAKYIS